jgi:hypothetical protein
MSGVIAASMQLFIMPSLLRRFNHTKMYHFCMKIWPCTFIALPSLNILARLCVDEISRKPDPLVVPILWTLIVVVLCLARVGFLGYS